MTNDPSDRIDLHSTRKNRLIDRPVQGADFFVFGPERTLVYRGQFDGSRPGSDLPVTGESLRAAVDAVLAGDPVTDDQRPSLGCSIKWKPGNEPFYFG